MSVAIAYLMGLLFLAAIAIVGRFLENRGSVKNKTDALDLGNSPNNEERQPNNTFNHWLISWIRRFKTYRYQHKAEEEHYTASDRSNRFMAIFTFVIAGASIASVFVGHRQWTAIRGQLDAMEADQRPWVNVSLEPIGPLTFEDGFGNVRVRLSLKNTGKTPAIGIRVQSEGYFPSETMDIIDKQNSICNAYAPKKFGDVIFPGDIITVEENVYFPVEETAKGRLPIHGMAAYVFRNPTLAICVSYGTFSGPDYPAHETGLSWQLFKKPDGERIAPDSDVPLDDLMITYRSRLGIGVHAD